MLIKRAVVVAAGGLLAVGGVVVVSGTAQAGSGGPSGHSRDGRPEVMTTSAMPTSVTEQIAGVGTVTVTFDPTTGNVASLIVTPLAGVTVGAAVPHGDRLEVPTTLADGTMQTLRVTAEDGKVEIELKGEPIEPAEETTTTMATTSTTATPATSTTMSTTSTTAEPDEAANEANDRNEQANDANDANDVNDVNEHPGSVTTEHDGHGDGGARKLTSTTSSAEPTRSVGGGHDRGGDGGSGGGHDGGSD